MKVVRVLALLVVLTALCVAACWSQAPVSGPTAADISAGIALLEQLKGTPEADAPIFQQVGAEHASTILMAVVSRGEMPTASAADWTQLHRAMDSLIELYAWQGQPFKAAIFGNLQAQFYEHNEGDFEAAVAATRKALDLQTRAGESKTLYIPYENLGDELIHLGRIEEGLDNLRHAHAIDGEPGNAVDGAIWGKIIAVELSSQDMEAAHRDSASFVEVSNHSPSKLFRGRALLAQASVAAVDEKYEVAVNLIRNALDATKNDPDSTYFPYEATANLLLVGEQAMSAIPYADALALCARIDKEFPDLPISVSGYARQIRDHRRRLAGDFDALLREQTASVDEAEAANNIPAEASALLTLSVDYAYLNESTQQIAALERALALDRSAPSDSANIYLHYGLLEALGNAYLAHKDASQARGLFTEITGSIDAMTNATVRARLKSVYASAELGKAGVAALDEDRQTAREIFAKALEPPVPSAPGVYQRSDVLLRDARFEREAGERPAETLRLYQEAISALHAEKDTRTEISARMQLIRFLAAESANLPDALKIARENLEQAKVEASSIVLADAQWRLHFLDGILAENTGNREQAIAAYLLAVNNLDRIRSGLSKQDLRQSFMDDDSVQELYRRLIALYTASGEKDKAWQFLERDKARAFLESLSGRRFAASPSPSSTSATKKSSATLDDLDQQIINLRLLLSPDNDSALRASGGTPEVLHARLMGLEDSFALARQQSSLVNSRATQPLALLPITLAGTEARLPAHTALIEYAILDHQLAAFVVTHTSANELHWQADTASLPGQLGQLSMLLAHPGASQDDLDNKLSSVSDLLLAPVLHSLPPDIDTLVIVPTQSLSLIPFEALPLPQKATGTRGFQASDSAPDNLSDDLMPRTLVVDQYAVAYLPSASTLQFLTFGPTSASPDLFLGAIGDQSSEGLPALPGTLDETAAIQRLYPRAIRVTGKAFTHQVAVNALMQHQEVHFATHGVFDTQAPLFSAIVTAPAPGQSTRLSLYEVMDLHLKARLVILSACETDRGQIAGGDEMEGLTRTFLQAGAESVVSSLWKVSDDSTSLLMASLHAHLRAGETIPVALRHAELQVRRKFPQPFYWAAFVDTGVR